MFPFAFWKVAGAAAPTLASLNYSLADIAGGGQSIIATGTNCAAVTAVNIWGATVAPSATTATTVTFTAPAHAAGTTTVSITSPGGTSGTLAFESWSPLQITGIDAYLDANKGVTATPPAVSAWLDQSVNARNFTQATGAARPTQTASQFGALPSIRFGGAQVMTLAAVVALSGGKSIFAVAKWSASVAGNPYPGMAFVGEVIGGYASFGTDAGGIALQQYDSAGAIQHYSGPRGSGLATGTPQLVGLTVDTVSNEKFYVGATQAGTTVSPGVVDDIANAYSSVGDTFASTSPLTADVGAIIVVSGIIASGDLTKTNRWSQQRFATP